MAAYEVLLLNTAIPQIQAAQSGDTYVVPRDIAINATAIISANSATDALRITQTGAGNAILVEDSANPDSTPFVVTAAGDVGIGTTNPGTKLDVVGTIQSNGVFSVNGTTTGTASKVWFGSDGASGGFINVPSSQSLSIYQNNATLVARFDSSGNLGLGVTPSAWGSGYKSLDIGSIASFFSDNNVTANISANQYIDAGGRKYKTANYATMYQQYNGQHQWYTAPSGTANSASVTSGASYTVVALGSSTLAQWQAFFNDSSNNPLTVTPTLGQVLTGNATGTLLGGGLVTQNISFTQAMTLDASGNLALGSTTATGRMSVDTGDGVVCFRDYGAAIGAGTGSALDFLNAARNAVVDGGIRATNLTLYGSGSTPMLFYTNSTERARITSGGDFQTSSGNSVMVGGTAARATTAGTNRVDIFDGTAPVGTLANGVSFYSASGEANVMDAAGNATLLSPHDAVTNEWIFRSKHTPTGKVLKIDVERLLKFINDHFGLDAVHEFVEE